MYVSKVWLVASPLLHLLHASDHNYYLHHEVDHWSNQQQNEHHYIRNRYRLHIQRVSYFWHFEARINMRNFELFRNIVSQSGINSLHMNLEMFWWIQVNYLLYFIIIAQTTIDTNSLRWYIFDLEPFLFKCIDRKTILTIIQLLH